jgi:hypothetical protein
MRSFMLSVILLAGVATIARAQGERLTAPINKARAAAAAAETRAKAHDSQQDPVPRRDSAQTAPAGAASGNAPATQPAGSRPPKLPPALPSVTASNGSGSKPASGKPAPVKPETTSAKPVTATAASGPAPKAADSAKVPASGKAPANPATPTDKNIAATPPPQVTPGKTPANGKSPGTATTPGSKAAPVTPEAAKPSATAEAAKDTPPPTSVSAAPPRNRPELAIDREVFQYDAAGRRDPFASLLLSSDLRPLFTDLLLVVINYDPQGRNSVAIMRDATTKEQYRVRQGQLIGRMRVSAIEPKRVMFTIDEFGFSRQEALVIGDTTKVRKQ